MHNSTTLRIRCADWTHGEIFAFIAALFVGADAEKLKYKLRAQYNSEILLVNSARVGILKTLESLSINNPSKRKVLVPEFICDSIPEIIQHAGLDIVKIKVNRTLNLCPIDLKNNICESSLAIIMPHMYGKVSDIESILSIARHNCLYLIDDAAQVTGVSKNKKLLGTFGDFGVLSFAQGKTVVTGVRGSGGVLINSCNYPLHIEETYPRGWGRLTNLWHFWATYNKKGIWAVFEYYRERICTIFKIEKHNYYSPKFSISHAESAIAIKQLEVLPELISLTELKADRCYKLSKKLNTISIPQWENGPCFLTRLVIQSTVIAPDKLKILLSNHSIESKFVYSNGSRAYDGSHTSGLLEIPWLGITLEEEIFLFNSLTEIELIES